MYGRCRPAVASRTCRTCWSEPLSLESADKRRSDCLRYPNWFCSRQFENETQKQKLDDRQNKSARNSNTTKIKQKERQSGFFFSHIKAAEHCTDDYLYIEEDIHITHYQGFCFDWDTLLVTDTLSFDCWNYTTDISRCQFGVRFFFFAF